MGKVHGSLARAGDLSTLLLALARKGAQTATPPHRYPVYKGSLQDRPRLTAVAAILGERSYALSSLGLHISFCIIILFGHRAAKMPLQAVL
ncbi:hypothetical protein WJX77_010763 [Trebouxia sp. C0004]